MKVKQLVILPPSRLTAETYEDRAKTLCKTSAHQTTEKTSPLQHSKSKQTENPRRITEFITLQVRNHA